MKKTAILILTLVALTAISTFAQSAVGTMDYFEGAVELIREDAILHSNSLSFGESVFDGETVRTRENGRAEVSLARSGSTTITVSANTAYTVTGSAGGGGGNSGVQVLFGKVSLAVEQATDDEALEVRTGTTAFGVRGTELDVITSPDGAVLMGVRDGEVVARGERGTTTVRAGQAVEVSPGGLFSRINVPSGRMNDYYDAWLELRAQTFRQDPLFFTRNYLERYADTRERFDSAAEDLIDEADTIRRMARGETSRADRMRLRGSVSPEVVAAKSALTLYEDAVYSLSDLLNMLDAEELEGLNRRERNAVREFREEQVGALQRLVAVKRLIRTYDSFELSVPSIQ